MRKYYDIDYYETILNDDGVIEFMQKENSKMLKVIVLKDEDKITKPDDKVALGVVSIVWKNVIVNDERVSLFWSLTITSTTIIVLA